MLCKKCHTEMTVMQEDNVSGLICPKCGWNIITTKIDDIMLDTQLYQLFVLKNEHINIGDAECISVEETIERMKGGRTEWKML